MFIVSDECERFYFIYWCLLAFVWLCLNLNQWTGASIYNFYLFLTAHSGLSKRLCAFLSSFLPWYLFPFYTWLSFDTDRGSYSGSGLKGGWRQKLCQGWLSFLWLYNISRSSLFLYSKEYGFLADSWFCLLRTMTIWPSSSTVDTPDGGIHSPSRRTKQSRSLVVPFSFYRKWKLFPFVSLFHF
jgi:hypothetical protein